MSIRHNEIIADMFSRLDIVEWAGTGIRKMRRLMDEVGLPAPKIKPGIFYRIVFARPVKEGPGKVTVKVPEKVTVNQTKILEAIASDPAITIAKLAEIVKISERKIKENISKLKSKGLLRRIGPDKGGHWEVIKRG